MTMEVSELLSQVALDTSGISSESSTPKRPGSLALTTTLPLKPEDSAKLVDTSFQVSAPEDVERDDSTYMCLSTPFGQMCGAQQGSSLCGCGPTPGGGQHGPGLLVGNQVFPRC